MPERAALRWCTAVVIVLTPLIMASWFALCPQYGDPACPTNARPLDALAAYRAAPPSLMGMFLLVNMVVAYLFPLSYLGMASVAWPGAARLAAIGAACGWIGSIVWGFIADQSFLLADMVRVQHDADFAALETAYFTDWHIFALAIGWVAGHLLGYAILGVALVRARAVPAWSGTLIVAAAVVMGPLAYGTGQNALQIIGYVMVAVGCVAAGRTLVRRPV